MRASAGIPARSHRAALSIQHFGSYSHMSIGAWRCPSVSTPNAATWQFVDLAQAPPPNPLPVLSGRQEHRPKGRALATNRAAITRIEVLSIPLTITSLDLTEQTDWTYSGAACC